MGMGARNTRVAIIARAGGGVSLNSGGAGGEYVASAWQPMSPAMCTGPLSR